MSKNTQLGNLVNGVYVDSSGKVGVANTSPTVALDVTGAGKFSTTVTAQTGFKLPANGNGTSPTLAYNNSLGFGVSGTGIFFGNLYNSDLTTAMQLRVTNSGGTDITAMTLLSSGNVGIGTSSPNISGQSSNVRVLTVSGVGGSWGGVEVNADISSGGQLSGFYGFSSPQVSTNMLAYIGCWLENSGSGAGADMRFHTKPSGSGATEKMRILANGNVLIGNTTDSGDRLRVTGSIASNGSSAGMFFQVRVAGNFLGFYSDNTSTMLLYNTNVGNIATINQSNGNYTALSDVNKKKDFEQSNIGLNEVLQLKPTLYRMKTDEDYSSKHLGFIAQEVKEYIPQAYTESGEGDKKFIGLTEMPIIAALVKAIQELSAEIETLKNK
jgi:hypothetical protein